MIKVILKNKTLKNLIKNILLFTVILLVCSLESIINYIVDIIPSVFYIPIMCILMFAIFKMIHSMLTD